MRGLKTLPFLCRVLKVAEAPLDALQFIQNQGVYVDRIHPYRTVCTGNEVNNWLQFRLGFQWMFLSRIGGRDICRITGEREMRP